MIVAHRGEWSISPGNNPYEWLIEHCVRCNVKDPHAHLDSLQFRLDYCQGNKPNSLSPEYQAFANSIPHGRRRQPFSVKSTYCVQLLTITSSLIIRLQTECNRGGCLRQERRTGQDTDIVALQ